MRFVLEEKAGAGATAVVHRARDVTTGEQVALKIFRGEGDPVEDEVRFEREAEILASLDHPSIVRYVAHGALAGGARYLAMEWIGGETLHVRLARSALPIADALALLRRLADIERQRSIACEVAHRPSTLASLGQTDAFPSLNTAGYNRIKSLWSARARRPPRS